MVSLKNKLTLLLLCAFVAAVVSQASQGGPHESQGGPSASQGGSHESQGGPHVSQGRRRREAPAIEEAELNDDGSKIPPIFTSCDSTTTPVISCSDCKTRLICKPIGGILISCRNPFRPHCNNGICSPYPAEGC